MQPPPATPPRACGSTRLRPVEAAVEPADESFLAAAPLLLTRIHPYCTGRVGGRRRRRRTEHRKQINVPSAETRGHGFGSPRQTRRSRLLAPDSGLRREGRAGGGGGVHQERRLSAGLYQLEFVLPFFFFFFFTCFIRLFLVHGGFNVDGAGGCVVPQVEHW